MATYIIEIRDRDGTPLGTFENAREITFNRRLNNYGTCSFVVAGNDPKLSSLTALRRYQTIVKRNGSVVWAGEQAVRRGRLDAELSNPITITSYDWVEQLRHRYTGPSVIFDQVDAGHIAWSLIDTAQQLVNGDMGITQGLIQPTQLRDRKYFNHNVYERLLALTEVIGGFDFEITHDKVFNVYLRKGMELPWVALQWGKNLRSVGITENFADPGNKAIVLGEGFEESQQRVERQDLDAQVAHGLRETITNEMMVTETQTLRDKGDALVRKFKQPILSLELQQMPNTEPFLSSATVGDRVRVRIQEGIYNIDNMMRIYAINIYVDDNNVETISYDVGIL